MFPLWQDHFPEGLNPSLSMRRHESTDLTTPKLSLCMFVRFTGSGDIASSAMPFPQAWSLSGALQEAQLQLLGKVMGMCAPAEQVRMLDGLRTSASGKVSKQRERGDVLQQQQHAVAARACIAALSGLQALVDRYKGMHPHSCGMYMSSFTDMFSGSACNTRCMPCSQLSMPSISCLSSYFRLHCHLEKPVRRCAHMTIPKMVSASEAVSVY